MDTYEYFLGTGSGSDRVTITFEDEGRVRGAIRSRWMTAPSHAFTFAGRYAAISEAYGWLRIDQIHVTTGQADAAGEEGQALPAGLVDTPLMVEYITVTRSNRSSHPDPVLEEMRSWGYANWNEAFDLLLIVPPFVFDAVTFLSDEGPTSLIPEDLVTDQYANQLAQIDALLLLLDKKKFKLLADPAGA